MKKNRLKFLRERSRLTQGEVGQIIGVDNTTVSKHESSSRGLSAGEISSYATLYKVESWEIFLSPEELGEEETAS